MGEIQVRETTVTTQIQFKFKVTFLHVSLDTKATSIFKDLQVKYKIF